MTEDQAFLQAILEAHDDDAPRLVYADWLDDHGDEWRAEFIRVQCEAARLPEGDPRRRELAARADELLWSMRGVLEPEEEDYQDYVARMEAGGWTEDPERWDWRGWCYPPGGLFWDSTFRRGFLD